MKALAVLLISFFSVNSFAQLSYSVDSIPLQDGKKLAADIYLNPNCSGQCPTILIQTPYNRQFYRFGLPLGIGNDITKVGYHIVIVDWRGFYGSAAAFDVNADRGIDGYDAIDWIAQQSWSDGQIGTWGPSALGKIQYQTADKQHPNHVCAVPLVAKPIFAYEDYYYGGVLEESRLERLDQLGYGLSPLVLAHQTYDFTWTYAESTTNYSSNISIPFLMIGGWYDHEINGMINYFAELKQNAPAASSAKLLIGPWVHGGSGIAQVGTATQGELSFPEAAGWSDSLALTFFDYHMLGQNNGWATFPDVKYFQIGENQWYDAVSWPTNDVTLMNLYLHQDHILKEFLPTNAMGSDAYLYDPKDPSPTIGGATLHTALSQGPYNQVDSVETRNDILIYTGGILLSDAVMKGIPKAHLFVSSDRKDTDFAIRLTDVYPDGTSMLISDGIKRMRFRNGYTSSDTSAIVPGQVYEVEINLPPVSYTFLAGHQVRIDITSSDSRRWDVNLNNGGDMYTSGDTLIATNTVFTNSSQASYIQLPLVSYPVSIQEEGQIEKQLIYPNPVKDIVYVSEGKWVNYTIYSIDGKELQKGKGNLVDVSSLPSGTYIFTILDEKGNRSTIFSKE